MSDIDASRKLLQQQTGDKPSVFDHFASIIDKVILQKPDDPHGALEVLSRLIKVPQPSVESFEEAELEEKKAISTAMMDVTKVPEEGEGGAKTVCAIPDFMEESAMFEWAGLGFGELESYQIMCSLRKLAADNEAEGISKLRFWGKILCTEKDYYVAEAQMEAAGDPDEEVALFEALGTGANSHAYYVTTSLTGTWVKLPNVYPQWIVDARKIKKILTGNLDSKVITHPHFTEKKLLTEKELLRAQIARITADTVLCAKGFLAENEDGEVAANEEFKCPRADELAKAEAWTHERDHILRNGACKHPELPEEADEEDEEAKKQQAKMKKEIEADPARSRIRPIATDPDLQWAVRQGGDKSLYKGGNDAESGAVIMNSYAVTTVRSLTWPGAVTVSKGGHFTNLYVGHGLKYGEPDFFPCAPLDIQEEPEDPGEQPEPQGPEGGTKIEGEEEGGG